MAADGWAEYNFSRKPTDSPTKLDESASSGFCPAPCTPGTTVIPEHSGGTRQRHFSLDLVSGSYFFPNSWLSVGHSTSGWQYTSPGTPHWFPENSRVVFQDEAHSKMTLFCTVAMILDWYFVNIPNCQSITPLQGAGASAPHTTTDVQKMDTQHLKKTTTFFSSTSWLDFIFF